MDVGPEMGWLESELPAAYQICGKRSGRSHLHHCHCGSARQLKAAGHKRQLPFKTLDSEDIRIPVGRNNAVPATFVAQESRDAAVHSYRLVLAQVVVEHEAGLIIGEDRL